MDIDSNQNMLNSDDNDLRIILSQAILSEEPTDIPEDINEIVDDFYQKWAARTEIQSEWCLVLDKLICNIYGV